MAFLFTMVILLMEIMSFLKEGIFLMHNFYTTMMSSLLVKTFILVSHISIIRWPY